MDLKQKLIDLSREATGDDSITVAGDVHEDAEHQTAVNAG